MSDTPQILADRLEYEGGRVMDFFNHLHSEQWAIQIFPERSQWNFHDLLAHFVSAEIGRLELIKDVCSGGKGVPSDFNIDSYNKREVERFSTVSNDELMERFRSERKKLSMTISSLSSEDLDKVGNDPFLGQVPLSEMIKLTYRHLQIHIREVRRYLV